MFLRCKVRRKDGKQHRYWSVVENSRVAGGRVVQRHVLYLGEINDTQELAWRRSIAVLEDGAAQPRRLSLFPGDRCEGLLADASIVRVKLSELQLRRPRQWGACWLGCRCGASCQLDQLWPKRLGVSRNAWAPLRAKTSAGDDEFRRSERRDRGFADSSLEGDGFEPSVPRRGQYFSRPPRSSVRGPPFRERGDRSRRKGKAVPWRVTSIVRAFDRHQAAGLALIGRSHARPVALL